VGAGADTAFRDREFSEQFGKSLPGELIPLTSNSSPARSRPCYRGNADAIADGKRLT
jgi:hypothetical protein